MLVLSRKVGEQICVPDCKLVLTVLQVRGATVRLGFVAPAEIEVVREELCRRSPKLRAIAAIARTDVEESTVTL